MAFWKKNKRKVEKGEVIRKVEDIYVATVEIPSDYNPTDFAGANMSATMYFLMTKEEEQYYELYSKTKVEFYESEATDDGTYFEFNTPYIKEVKPFIDFLVNKNTKEITDQDLFDFIITKNTYAFVKPIFDIVLRKEDN